ncbi:MAG: maleylpyruvate isomerase family mycothiol-dependent enzyme [Mycobacterium sp.]|nr:maleylpyruvate isomerase family mycothiol-dependent enzyme [Mycobacterium sp.]
MVAGERADLVELLRTLSDDDWLVPSLCKGWRVHDVVAHLLIDTVSVATYGGVLVRKRSFDRVNQHFVDQAKDLPTRELISRLESTVGRGWVSRTMPSTILSDLVVHHQDIRRPLGRPRTIDPARLLHTLRNPDPFAKPRRYTKGLKFVASDIDWAAGSGPEVRGAGEALALAMVGRGAVLNELEGDGVALLTQRIQT